ncbi:hypothetical protein [Parashewanella tropica]|uniref:hypothetical protein n=1 Tax=Parashewanella tropica TaxID=2547970 RepID=UPI00105A0770|nr:hypothetical protein [Parashewanella tropica]
MKSLILSIALLFCPSLWATTLSIKLQEDDSNRPYYFVIDFHNFATEKRRVKTGNLLDDQMNAPLEIRDGFLYHGEWKVAPAHVILFNRMLENNNFVIVRELGYSFDNPQKLLSALTGHPVEFSSIYALKLKHGKLLKKRLLLKKDSSEDWDVWVKDLDK